MTTKNRIVAGDGDPRHGTVNGYGNHRCRCDRCRRAWAREHNAYMHEHPEQVKKATARAKALRRERGVQPADLIDPAAVAELAAAGLTAAQIARKLGRPRASVGRLARRHDIPLAYRTADLAARVAELAAAGHHGKQIAAELDVHPSTVLRIARQHGIRVADGRERGQWRDRYTGEPS